MGETFKCGTFRTARQMRTGRWRVYCAGRVERDTNWRIVEYASLEEARNDFD